MKSSDVQIGKNYWVKPSADLLARKALIVKAGNTEPRCFQCISDEGDRYMVFAEAILRAVEPEPCGVLN